MKQTDKKVWLIPKIRFPLQYCAKIQFMSSATLC